MKLLNKIISINIILCFIFSACKKNEPSSIQKDEFFKSFGGAYENIATDFIFSNNSYFVLGNEINEDGLSKIFLIKTDEFGNRMWEKNYSEQEKQATQANQLKKLKDKNEFVIIGSIEIDSDSLYSDIYYLHIDADGNVIHNKIIEFAGSNETGIYIQELENGNLTIGVNTVNELSGINGRYYFPIDINGDVINNKIPTLYQGQIIDISTNYLTGAYRALCYNFQNKQEFVEIYENGNEGGGIKSEIEGEYNNFLIDENENTYVVGKINSGSNGKQDAYISQIDIPNFSVIWTLELGSSGDDWASDIVINESGNLLVTGSVEDKVNNTLYNIFVAEVSTNGELLNYITIGGVDNEYGNKILPSDNSSFVIQATTYFENSSFISLIKQDFK